MRDLASFQNVYLHRQPVDGRKQINGLSILVNQSMEHDPFGTGLFAFVNKGRDVIRLLYWDRTGFALWTKRLEKDKFRWPAKFDSDVIELDAKGLSWLLEGLDLAAFQPHQAVSYTAIT